MWVSRNTLKQQTAVNSRLDEDQGPCCWLKGGNDVRCGYWRGAACRVLLSETKLDEPEAALGIE